MNKNVKGFLALTGLMFFYGEFLGAQTGPAMGAAPKADSGAQEVGDDGWSAGRGTADVAVPAPQAAAGPLTITDIRINGLKRTKKSYMDQVLKKYRGMAVEDLDLSEVETDLHAQEIFSETAVRVETEENGAVLVIDVKEKISFVPLPFFAVSEGEPMGGLFVMDTNASGRKNTYVVGGVLSRDYLMGISAYSKPSLSLTQPGFSLSASGFIGESLFTDRRKEEELRYKSRGFTAGAKVLDKMSEHSSASLGAQFLFRNFEEVDDYRAPEDLRTLAFSASYGQLYNDWNGWFMSQKSASVSAEYGLSFKGDDFQELGADFLFQHPTFSDRLRLQVKGGIHKLYKGEPAQMMGAGAAGISILPSDFFSDFVMGATAGLEWAFTKGKWMTLSLYGLYEVVRSEEWKGDTFLNQGFSFGTKMYLSKIAFPAMALGISRNLTEKMTRASFSLGVGL